MFEIRYPSWKLMALDFIKFKLDPDHLFTRFSNISYAYVPTQWRQSKNAFIEYATLEFRFLTVIFGLVLHIFWKNVSLQM